MSLPHNKSVRIQYEYITQRHLIIPETVTLIFHIFFYPVHHLSYVYLSSILSCLFLLYLLLKGCGEQEEGECGGGEEEGHGEECKGILRVGEEVL